MSGFFSAVAAGGDRAANVAQPPELIEREFEPVGQMDFGAVVLAVVEEGGTHAPEDHLLIGVGEFERWQLAGGFAADVGNDNIRPIIDSEAGGLDSAAKIDFFVIEKEGGVEEAGFEERFAAEDEKGAGDPIGFSGLEGVAQVRSGAPKMRERGKRAERPVSTSAAFQMEWKERAEGCQEPSRPTWRAPATPASGFALMCSMAS